MAIFNCFFKLSSVALFILLFTNCKDNNCCVTPPVESQFHGKWELEKVTNGFAQLELSGTDIGYKEELNFNATTGLLVKKRDAKETLKSKFQIGKEGGQDAIILIDDESYHWYSFKELGGSLVLVLYENCPIGVALADGSYYEYRKVE